MGIYQNVERMKKPKVENLTTYCSTLIRILSDFFSDFFYYKKLTRHSPLTNTVRRRNPRGLTQCGVRLPADNTAQSRTSP